MLEKNDHNIGFNDNRQFFAENGLKKPVIEIITLAPSHGSCLPRYRLIARIIFSHFCRFGREDGLSRSGSSNYFQNNYIFSIQIHSFFSENGH
jgi:hypothetical protein